MPEDPGPHHASLPPRDRRSGRLAKALDFLLRCDVADPDLARTGRVVAGILLVLMPHGVLAILAYGLLAHLVTPALPGLAGSALLLVLYLHNRRGRVATSAIAMLAIVFLTLNASAVLTRHEVRAIAYLPYMWAIPISLGGAVLSARGVLALWGLSYANILVLHFAFLHEASGNGPVQSANWLLSAAMVLTTISLGTAFVRHQSDRHARALRERNAELADKQRELLEQQRALAELNDSLESQVRARTAELTAARDEALRASRVKSDFLSNMSHEMRTPMNAVLGMTRMLLGTPLAEDQRALANDVRAAGEHLLGVIDDVLDLSRIESGEIAIREAPFDVRRCVDEAVKLVAGAAADKGLTLRVEVADKVPPAVITDASRVRQVLVHLLVNAVKFTPRGTLAVRVDVAGSPRAGVEGPALRFSVEDTGIGIPSDRRDSLFALFAQLDTSSTRRYGGAGVGLVLCKHIVERLGGELTFESELGQGSTFTFTLPAPAHREDLTPSQDAASAGPDVPLERTADSHPLRILSVEDNPMNQKVLLALLRRLGYGADTASNGVEAVRAVEDNPYDVVLMDIQMPEMDGMEAARTINTRVPPPVRPHIIAVTAHAMTGYREQCLDAGMNDYLPKPMSPEMLQAALLRARARDTSTLHQPAILR